jgi:hypothetical protein
VGRPAGARALRIVQESPNRFRIEREGGMRVPGVVCASRVLLPDVSGDRSLEQVANVATLPGIVCASYAMPDVHWGYGFPIGGSRRRTWTRTVSCRPAVSASTSPAG